MTAGTLEPRLLSLYSLITCIHTQNEKQTNTEDKEMAQLLKYPLCKSEDLRTLALPDGRVQKSACSHKTQESTTWDPQTKLAG